MKNIITLAAVACLLCGISCAVSAQPNTKFRPDRTVFLYQDEPESMLCGGHQRSVPACVHGETDLTQMRV